MTHVTNLLFGAVLIVAGVAGCIGTGSGASTGASGGGQTVPSSAPQGEFTDETGAIHGVVTDPEYVALGGALLSLKEANATASSAADGTFSFSLIAPGDYTLIAAKLGYEAFSAKVTVKAGETNSNVKVLLSPLPVVESYAPIFQFDGYITCTIGYSVVLSEECGQGLQTDYGTFGRNPNNNIDWRFNMTTTEHLANVLVELTWTPASAAAQQLDLYVATNSPALPTAASRKTVERSTATPRTTPNRRCGARSTDRRTSPSSSRTPPRTCRGL